MKGMKSKECLTKFINVKKENSKNEREVECLVVQAPSIEFGYKYLMVDFSHPFGQELPLIHR